MGGGYTYKHTCLCTHTHASMCTGVQAVMHSSSAVSFFHLPISFAFNVIKLPKICSKSLRYSHRCTRLLNPRILHQQNPTASVWRPPPPPGQLAVQSGARQRSQLKSPRYCQPQSSLSITPTKPTCRSSGLRPSSGVSSSAEQQ